MSALPNLDLDMSERCQNCGSEWPCTSCFRPRAPKIVGTCAGCGLKGHRYGTTDPEHAFDAMGCVNSLKGLLRKVAKASEPVVISSTHHAISLPSDVWHDVVTASGYDETGQSRPCTCPENEPWLPEWDGKIDLDPDCVWHGGTA